MHQWANPIFALNPELFHTLLAKKWANWAQNSKYISEKLRNIFACTSEEENVLETYIIGQKYKSPIWLAAWFAKELDGLKILENMWFGYVVLGSVTFEKQQWNNKPRIQRDNDIKTLFNWMWLPWSWAEAVAQKANLLKQQWQRPQTMKTWMSLANSNIANNPLQWLIETEDQHAMRKGLDLADSLSATYDHAEVFEVNVSCPNVHGGTSNQGSSLDIILGIVQKRNQEEATRKNISPKPIIIKIWPLTAQTDPAQAEDITMETLELIVDIAIRHKINGITATNTSKERNGIPDGKIRYPKWWMSWAKLHYQSLNTIQHLDRLLKEKNSDIIINGVGGIGCEWSLEDLGNFGVTYYDQWASTLQIYSWLVAGSVMLPLVLKKKIAAYKQWILEEHQ